MQADLSTAKLELRGAPQVTASQSSASSAATQSPAFLKSPRWYLIGWGMPVALGIVSVVAQSISGLEAEWLSWPKILLVALAVGTVVTDSGWRKIPNWMTYPVAVVALYISAIVSLHGPSPWIGSLDWNRAFLGAVVCFACMLTAYRASGGGAGDVKLATAYGALLGWEGGLSLIIMAYMVAGIVLLLLHLASDRPWLLPKALVRLVGASWFPKWVAAPDDQQRQVLSRPIPLAAAFAVGLIIVLSGGNLFSA